EDAWAALKARLVSASSSVPDIDAAASELDAHALAYGLVYAADGQPAATRASLYERLKQDWGKTDVVKDRVADRTRVAREKQELIGRYGISPESVRICGMLAHVSHIRLET